MNCSEIPHDEACRDAEFFEEEVFPKPIDWVFHPAMPTKELARIVNWWMDKVRSRKFAADLLEDIRHNGIIEPLVECYGYLEGNHRFAAAIALGLATVPVYRGTSKRPQ